MLSVSLENIYKERRVSNSFKVYLNNKIYCSSFFFLQKLGVDSIQPYGLIPRCQICAVSLSPPLHHPHPFIQQPTNPKRNQDSKISKNS